MHPAPDPLAGVEQRARRVRRHRAVGAVTRSALAVALVAVGVPAALQAVERPASLQPAAPGPRSVAPFPSPLRPQPTRGHPAPSPTSGQASSYGLDPSDPWPLRSEAGLPFAQADGDAVEAVWEEVHGTGWRFSWLWAEQYGPSQQQEIAFLASRGDRTRWGVVALGVDELLHDAQLAPGTRLLAAVLPGDEAPRLLALAAPDVEVQYSSTGAPRDFRGAPGAADGVGVFPLGPDVAQDRVRALAADGQVVREVAAPNPAEGLVRTAASGAAGA